MYRQMWLSRIVVVLFAAFVVQVAAFGQSPAQPDRPNANRAGMWNPEFMMDIYVKALTRQYNLSPDQEEYTRKLLTKRVKEFLKDHETDLRTLMYEMLEFQQQRQLPPSETAKQWSSMGKPIFKDARKAILDGNKEWHEILNDSQRKRHDADVEMLQKQFKIMEERLNRWGKGDIQPDDFTPAGSKAPTQIGRAWTDAKPEDTWEMYVRMFSVRYGLDASQRETAQSVLRECRDRAAAYRDKHKADFEEVTTKLKEVKESRSKDEVTKESLAAMQKNLDQIREKNAELEKPISEGIFNEFKQRLDQIPTKEQRAAFDQKEKARLESIRARLGEEKGGKKEKAEEESVAATAAPPTTAPAPGK